MSEKFPQNDDIKKKPASDKLRIPEPVGFHAMLWARDASGTIAFLSDAWFEFAGLPPDSDPQVCWNNSLLKEDQDAALKALKAAEAQKTEFTVQYRLRRRDGLYRWIADSGAPRYDEYGEFCGYTGSCVDITDLKASDSLLEDYTENLEQMIQERVYALHEKENQLKYFLDSLPDAAWIKDHNGTYLLVNSAFASFYGMPEESFPGKTAFDILPETEARTEAEEDVLVALEGATINHEKKFEMTGGRTVYLEILKRPIYNHVEEIMGIAGIARDITERKRAEIILKNANEELERQVAERTVKLNREKSMIELFYNLVPSGVFTSDGNCVITSWNHRAEDITGCAASETIGKTCPFIRRQCFGKPVNLDELRESQFVVKEGEWIRPDGKPVYLLKKTTAVRDESGAITGRIESFEDITERREAERSIQASRIEAERANRMKSEFLANMSHEIRTPMNSIIGFADMLFAMNLTNEQMDCLSYIKTSSQTLLALINDILDFSKIEAGKLEIESVEFELNRVLYEVAGIITPLLDAKKLKVDIANTFDLKHHLIGDPNRIRQIILNFATNAIKFSKENDIKILFELVSETDTEAAIMLGVEDRGIGIAPEKLGQIFLPFVQSDSSTTRRFGGTGLGLAISNQLAKLMGAEKIFVESRIGCGSKFYFTLKLKKGSEIKGAPVNRPSIKLKDPAAPKKLRAKVLLAEDSHANIALMTKLMKILGHDVSVAENGIVALEAARRERFDLIFMDVQMPEMDGIEATRRIREFDGEIPIVAMTAGAMKDDLESCLAAGMNAYLSKPINVAEIEGVIIKALSSRMDATKP